MNIVKYQVGDVVKMKKPILADLINGKLLEWEWTLVLMSRLCRWVMIPRRNLKAVKAVVATKSTMDN